MSRTGLHETSYVLERSDAKLVVTSPDYLDLFAEVVPSIPDVTGLVVARGDGTPVDSPIASTPFDDLLEAPPRRTRTKLDSEDPVQILFTSGTTARPKACRPHARELPLVGRARGASLPAPRPRIAC